MRVQDHLIGKRRWIRREFLPQDGLTSEQVYARWRDGVPGFEPTDVRIIDGNLLLNEGITALQNLLTGAAETNFGNANAYLGVGDSATAAAASQTGLQAPTNKLYKAMEASYPSISAQTTTWRAVFGSAEANWAWNEVTVANGSSDAADNLNRKVQSLGTKASPATWTLDVEITWS